MSIRPASLSEEAHIVSYYGVNSKVGSVKN